MTLPITMVDVLAGLVVLVSAGYAAWRGFLSEILSVFAWASAAFATLYFGPWLIPLMRDVIATNWMASLAAYAGIFLLVLIPLSFMAHRFSETVKHSPIGPLDRALGVAFGVVRGLVIVGLAYLLFTFFVPIRQQPRWVTEARLLPVVQSSGEILLSLVPNRDHADFADTPGAKRGDAVGDLIRKQNEEANAVHDSPAQDTGKAAGKTYGAKDRRALDTLLQKSGEP